MRIQLSQQGDRVAFEAASALTSCVNERVESNAHQQRIPIGAMEKVSRKVHKASTHQDGLIRVDGAAGKRHCASPDYNTATLPADAK